MLSVDTRRRALFRSQLLFIFEGINVCVHIFSFKSWKQPALMGRKSLLIKAPLWKPNEY